MSARMSTDPASLACSGAMKSSVPSSVPCMVWRLSQCRARPKSTSLAWPSGVTRTFDGLMSRWTRSCSCALQGRGDLVDQVARAATGPRVRPYCSKSCPGTYSITKYRTGGARARPRVRPRVNGGHDVRVLKAGHRSHLGGEPGRAARIVRVGQGQHLDRDLAAQRQLLRLVHDTGAAGTESVQDAIVPEDQAGRSASRDAVRLIRREQAMPGQDRQDLAELRAPKYLLPGRWGQSFPIFLNDDRGGFGCWTSTWAGDIATSAVSRWRGVGRESHSLVAVTLGLELRANTRSPSRARPPGQEN